MCFFLNWKIYTFHYSDWSFLQCFRCLLLYNKLSGLRKQPDILLLIICGSGIWAGFRGDSFFSIPSGIGWGFSTGARGSPNLPRGLSGWSLIIHQTRLSFLTWHWDCSKNIKTAARNLKALTWKSDSVTFATFCWPKQVTGPPQNQAEGKRFHLLMEVWQIPIAKVA